MSKKLTLEDRYYISMYSRKLECTLKLRFAIDNFLDQIAITSDEMDKYDITINKETMQFESNDESYSVEYEEFPQEVLESMGNYISMYDHEKNKENLLLKRTMEYFRKVL